MTLEYTTNADTVPPLVVSETPSANSTNVGLETPIVIKFSELLSASSINGSTVYLEAAGSSTPAASTVAYSGSTVVLTPTAALLGNTTYTVTVTTGVTDRSGNALAAAVSWSFTTGTGQWQQSTAADFNAGSNSTTTVTNASGGEVQLAPVFYDDFSGTALSSSWTATATGGGMASLSVSGSVLSIGAEEVDSTQVYTTAGVEGSVAFGAAAYQHFGLATSLSSVAGNYWAIFSTGGTTNTLFARVNLSGATQDVSLGALPSGFHDYVIKPVSNGFQFLVDGVLQTTLTVSFPSPLNLKVVLSDYSGSPTAPLQADSIRVLSYPSSGTFTSTVFDATRTATWGTVSWTANLPAGTSIQVLTRSGATATPDAELVGVDGGGRQRPGAKPGRPLPAI